MRTKWIGGLLGVLFAFFFCTKALAQVIVQQQPPPIILRERPPRPSMIGLTAHTNSLRVQKELVRAGIPQPQLPPEEPMPFPPPSITESEADVRCSAAAEEAELEISAFLYGLREVPKGGELLFRWDHPEGWHRCYDAVRRSFERSFERLVRILPAPSP